MDGRFENEWIMRDIFDNLQAKRAEKRARAINFMDNRFQKLANEPDVIKLVRNSNTVSHNIDKKGYYHGFKFEYDGVEVSVLGIRKEKTSLFEITMWCTEEGEDFMQKYADDLELVDRLLEAGFDRLFLDNLKRRA